MGIFLWIATGSILLIVYMAFIEPNRLVIRRVRHKGALRKRIRIVHFSDTHFHEDFSYKNAQRLIDCINAQKPDLIIFSGDCMDHYDLAPDLPQRLVPLLSQLQAKTAKLAVYGNHDIGGGAKTVYPKLMAHSGFQVLCNEIWTYEEAGLAVFGIDDAIAGYEDGTFLKQQVQPYQILIAHEPDLIDSLDMHTIDLMMSGHTHGGQIYIPGLMKFVLPKGGRHHRKGWYQKDHTALFVSSGIGMTALPLRFMNPPEIVVYDIEP